MRLVPCLITLTLVLGCASRPPNESCQDGIRYLTNLNARMSVGGILRDQLRIALVQARDLREQGEHEKCVQVVNRARSKLEGGTLNN